MCKSVIRLALIGLLSACATTQAPYVPPVQTRDLVIVNTAFRDLPNATRIDIQDGKRVQKGNLDRWSTYCRLFVYNRRQESDYVASVEPGSFEIVGVELRYDSPDTLDRPWGHHRFGWHYYHPPAFYRYKVGMRLTSTDQPDVQSLDCYRKWSTRGYYYPSLAEIRQTLGDLIEIRRQP